MRKEAIFCSQSTPITAVRKSCDFLNVQVISDKSERIRWFISGIPGAAHDKTALEFDPEFIQVVNSLPDPFVVMGDNAYRGISDKLICSFAGRSLHVAQEEFNSDLARHRQIIERSYWCHPSKMANFAVEGKSHCC